MSSAPWLITYEIHSDPNTGAPDTAATVVVTDLATSVEVALPLTAARWLWGNLGAALAEIDERLQPDPEQPSTTS
ncbi:MAG: hypothetical protein OXG44_17400 [Gammaproteobacteria bacterium]|nr:hypothetical protein [Gammaproteobacteria bacterium]